MIGEPECIYTDPMTEVRSVYYRVSVTRSMSYADLMKMNKKGLYLWNDIIHSKFYKSNYRNYIIYVYHDETPPKDWKSDTQLHLVRPSTGVAANVWTWEDIEDKYVEITENAESLWTQAEQRSQTECIHGPDCHRPHCEMGKAIQTVHIVTGQFVVLWGYLEACVPKGKTLRLVQVSAKKGDEEILITGVRILGGMSKALKEKLKAMEEMQKKEVEKQKLLTEEHKKRQKEAYEREQEKKRNRDNHRSHESQLDDLNYSRLKWRDMFEYGRVLRRTAARRHPIIHDPLMPGLIPLYGSEGVRLLNDTARRIIRSVNVKKHPGLYPLTVTEEVFSDEEKMDSFVRSDESTKEDQGEMEGLVDLLSETSFGINSSTSDSLPSKLSKKESMSSDSSTNEAISSDLSNEVLSSDSSTHEVLSSDSSTHEDPSSDSSTHESVSSDSIPIIDISESSTAESPSDTIDD